MRDDDCMMDCTSCMLFGVLSPRLRLEAVPEVVGINEADALVVDGALPGGDVGWGVSSRSAAAAETSSIGAGCGFQDQLRVTRVDEKHCVAGVDSGAATIGDDSRDRARHRQPAQNVHGRRAPIRPIKSQRPAHHVELVGQLTGSRGSIQGEPDAFEGRLLVDGASGAL